MTTCNRSGCVLFAATSTTRAPQRLTDPVVAEFLTKNAEVRSELGVHTDRKLRCHLHNRAPEPDTLAEDNKALATKANNALNPWHSARISPVFYHLPPRGGKSWSFVSFVSASTRGRRTSSSAS